MQNFDTSCFYVLAVVPLTETMLDSNATGKSMHTIQYTVRHALRHNYAQQNAEFFKEKKERKKESTHHPFMCELIKN